MTLLNLVLGQIDLLLAASIELITQWSIAHIELSH